MGPGRGRRLETVAIAIPTPREGVVERVEVSALRHSSPFAVDGAVPTGHIVLKARRRLNRAGVSDAAVARIIRFDVRARFRVAC